MKIEKLPSGSYRIRKMYKGQMYTVVFNEKPTREFDTLKCKKVPQSLEIGLFFCQIFIFII